MNRSARAWRLAAKRAGLAGLALAVVVALPGTGRPQPPPAIKLTISPAAVPSPALKYQLLPELKDQTPGNAALLYYRAFSPEWTTHRRSESAEPIDKWLENTRQLPGPELRWVLSYKALQEVDRAARREYCDWELTSRVRKESFATLLPDVQSMRPFANLLAIRARLEIAEGHYDKAAYTLQTGFALARHVSEGPTLIHGLVGIAFAGLMAEQLEEFIQARGAPNLYWALTDLPRPFIDLRKPLQGEKLMVYGILPQVSDIENTPLTPGQQQELLKAIQGVVWGFADGRSASEWQLNLSALAWVIKAYPEAKRSLIAQGRKAEEVQALPALQVVVVHSLRQYRQLQDEVFKWYGLPYWEAQPGLEEAEKQIKMAKQRLQAIPFILFLPAAGKVHFGTVRMDRRIAALRCLEAIRLYAAGHSGRLPAALSDISEVPIPSDPVTGKSFDYKLAGGKATLYGPPPPGEVAAEHNTISYELTLKRSPHAHPRQDCGRASVGTMTGEPLCATSPSSP